MEKSRKHRWGKALKILFLAYLVVLGISHIIRLTQPNQFPYLEGQAFAAVDVLDDA